MRWHSHSNTFVPCNRWRHVMKLTKPLREAYNWWLRDNWLPLILIESYIAGKTCYSRDLVFAHNCYLLRFSGIVLFLHTTNGPAVLWDVSLLIAAIYSSSTPHALCKCGLIPRDQSRLCQPAGSLSVFPSYSCLLFLPVLEKSRAMLRFALWNSANNCRDLLQYWFSYKLWSWGYVQTPNTIPMVFRPWDFQSHLSNHENWYFEFINFLCFLSQDGFSYL